MEKMEKDIFDLIVAYYSGRCTEEEKGFLEEWILSSEENNMLFEKTIAGFQRIFRAETDTLGEGIAQEILVGMEGFASMRRRKRLYRLSGLAAALLLLVSLGVFWAFQEKSVADPLFAEGGLPEAGKEVFLKTASGKVFELSRGDTVSGGVALPGNMTLLPGRNELVLNPDQAGKESLDMMEIDVMRGAEYKIMLEDGTRVFLNSASTIRFPETFGQECRRVEISGEAYFEVSRDEVRPFIISSGDFTVEVLGTVFAIRNYPEEADRTVTLAEGSVKVSHRGEQLLLEPGYQVLIGREAMVYQEADLSRELAWVDGVFLFDNDPLCKVLAGLSRWYDVRFEFEDSMLGEEPFTGKMGRDIGVEEILALIERTDVVEFHRSGDTYIVKNKRQNRDENQ